MSKAKKALGRLKLLSKYLTTRTLDLMYKSFVRPHMDFCDVIYHEPSKDSVFGQMLTKLMEDVEKLQYKAALIATGTWQGSNRLKVYDELGWESLSDRRRSRRILSLYKIVNGNTPLYLRELLPQQILNADGPPPQLQATARYNATERFKNSFLSNAIKEWNVVMPHFMTMPSYLNLKKHLLTLFRPAKKSIFNISDPRGAKYIFQIRVGLSPLRAHKFQHNFADTPTSSCTCGLDAESTSHFLFKCPIYAPQRASLAMSVIAVLTLRNLNQLANSVAIYLYGHPDLPEDDNKKVLEATIKFIKETILPSPSPRPFPYLKHVQNISFFH